MAAFSFWQFTPVMLCFTLQVKKKASSGSCRLDRLVSGVLVLARTSSAATQLSQHISQQLVVKEYLARVKVGTITHMVFTLTPEWVELVCKPCACWTTCDALTYST